VENRVTCPTEFPRGSPQEDGAIVCGVGVEGRADAFKRGRPRLLNRRSDVPAPEAGYVQETPDQMVRADRAEQEQIQGESGGTNVTVPQNESAEQAGISAIRGIVESSVAVDEEQKHISVSQVGAGRNAFGAIFAVLVAER